MEFSIIKFTLLAVAMLAPLFIAAGPAMAQKKPNVVMLMTDDTGWNDFGAYTGVAQPRHPTPNIDRVARKAWSLQAGMSASCTRAAPPS